MPIYIDPEGNEHSIQQVRTTYYNDCRMVVCIATGRDITDWEMVKHPGNYKGVKAKKAKGDGKGLR